MAKENFDTEQKENTKAVDETEAAKETEAAEADSEAAEKASEEYAENSKEAAAESKASESDAADSKAAGEDTASQGKADKKDALIEELNDKLKRQLAEFENFRNRTEKEKSSMYDMGAKSVIEKLLPVVDNFERAMDAAGSDHKDSFAQGVEMIYKQLMTALTDMGVTPIDAVGKPFDPELHNAVMHVDDEAYGEQEVVEEMQKGYLFHETVVRHSMVKVAN